MKDTKDNFSQQSESYATYRPGYPQELFDWLFDHCTSFEAAWDCATGNGQAAINIVAKFEIVYATDLSTSQLENSKKENNIIYKQEQAEHTSFAENSFDLVTVAQALHWFHHKQFFDEVQKVAKPGALFAAWGYDLPRINNKIDNILDDFYTNIIGPYWDGERKHVDEHYRNIIIPFDEIPCPAFEISYDWTREHLLGYVSSWSAVQHYMKDKGTNPVEILAERLQDIWSADSRRVTFPVFMRAGYIRK